MPDSYYPLYRKTSNRRTAPGRRWASHTGRGSDSFVLIEAGGFYPKFYGRPMAQTIEAITYILVGQMLTHIASINHLHRPF